MSGTSSSGVPSGVVQNSALSFVAHAQPTSSEVSPVSAGNTGSTGEPNNQTDCLMPAGLKALYEVCSNVYPDQPNPLQVTTRLKYWLGGQDPLDYISMYWNPGKPNESIPSHWHYVSFGLSDLHGDGRVHPEPNPIERCSGYGLEITFRLASEAREPPLWPAALLQQLARYIFTTGNKFCAGDHVTWHAALDGSESRVRHLLVADDPQLSVADTPHGTVAFVQMVGCTSRELRAAQRGSGFEVLKALSEDPRCGGSWLVTRAQRRVSARLGSHTRRAAHLAGVSARVRWQKNPSLEDQSSCLSPSVERQIKETLQRGLSSMSDRGTEGHNMSTDSFEMSSIERALPQLPEMMQGSWRGEDEIEYLDGVHLMLNAEGASLLPLAIDGRVLHDRHFTWRQGPRAVTILPPSVAGALVSEQRPYATRGDWLQILIPRDLAQEMSKQLSDLSHLAESDSESEGETEKSPRPSLPLVYTWPTHRLTLSVLHDMEILY
ncbi:suppressor of fused homolog isoform X2 [Maniola hyperantus]|uniref:suppressor of fused homolog isoform X2 n=1 Tax=Aphantopus hyperantus TaxID=2795564 RepID=UPI0015688FAC|nr:suppressor of fused homolog [Maniola hyperantus]